MLASLCGDLPWPKVVTTYNRWAKPGGFRQRTTTALLRRCDHLHLQRRCVGEWITSGVVCKLLGISYEAVKRWINDDWLPSYRRGQSAAFPHYFCRKDLRRLARERPHLFGGQTESTLIQLLDNETLARQIVAMELPHPRQSIAVVCIEKGRRYASIGQAARAVYVTPSRLRVVVDHPDRTAAGYHWRTA
jgi:hypothetical protein